MLKVYWLIATEKVGVAINGGKRENFKKWDKVLVTVFEKNQLLRLWFQLVEEKALEFKDIFSDKPIKTDKKAETQV